MATPWVGSGTETDPNRPLVADEHQAPLWVDATGQPTEHLLVAKNPYCVEVECDSAALAAPVVLAAGDRLALVAPTPADSTLADVLVALRGTAT